MMIRAYRFRLYPSQTQTEARTHHLWLSKELWNRMLEHCKNMFRSEYRFPTKKELREVAKHQGLYSQVAQELVDRLEESVIRYFQLRRTGAKCGFPRFKSFHRMKSLCYPQMGFKLSDNKLRVTPFGEIRLKLHRIPKGRIKTLVLKREPSGRWFGILTSESDEKRVDTNQGSEVGIDLGLTKLAVVSDGTVIPNPRHLKRYEDKIAILGRRLSKKKKGSRNREKARVKLSRTYEKLGNARRDFLHKVSHSFVRKYSLVALENLSTKNMVQNHFGKQINDAAWYTLANMLCYKAGSAGCRVVFVDARGTSQECSRCGGIIKKGLQDRIHKCRYCGLVMDRDLNAAHNILKRATAGHAERNACEVATEVSTMKQEAHTSE